MIFPSNDDADGTVQFRFTGDNLVNFYPATYIWRVNLVQQDGYYTTFFWGPDSTFTGAGYYGCHPYPKTPPSGSTHFWEISCRGEDYVDDDNANDTTVEYGQWFTQACRVEAVGSDLQVKFYWDLPDTSKVMTFLADEYLTPAASPALTWGDAPWNSNNERLSGTLRGIQIYDAALDEEDILTEAANDTVNTPQTAAGEAAVWYMNQNPTPDDISDKSGAGHDPAWLNSNRPELYEE